MAGVNLWKTILLIHLWSIPRVAGVNLKSRPKSSNLECIPRVAGVNLACRNRVHKNNCIPRVAGVNLCYLYPQAFAVRILHVVRVNLVRSILSGL